MPAAITVSLYVWQTTAGDRFGAALQLFMKTVHCPHYSDVFHVTLFGLTQ